MQHEDSTLVLVAVSDALQQLLPRLEGQYSPAHHMHCLPSSVSGMHRLKVPPFPQLTRPANLKRAQLLERAVVAAGDAIDSPRCAQVKHRQRHHLALNCCAGFMRAEVCLKHDTLAHTGWLTLPASIWIAAVLSGSFITASLVLGQ